MRVCAILSVALAFSFFGICASITERALAQSNRSGNSIESEVASHFNAGQEAIRTGQTERAIREFREVLRLAPDLAEARVNLGLAYYMAGQYQEASIELEKARQKKQDLVAPKLFLGMAYLKLGLPAKAIPPLEEVVRQDPENKEALETLAASFLGRDNYRDATKVFLKLFAANADHVEGWYSLGQNYLAMAKQLSNEISGKFQGTVWEARLAGDLLRERQDWVDAAARYRRAQTLDPMVPGLHAALGDMLLRQGMRKDAEAEYRAELQRRADDEDALLGLAEADLEDGAAAPALEEVGIIWAVFPPFLGHQTNFPSVNIDPPKLAALSRDLASAPDSPAREFLLGAIYRAMGKNEQVSQQWSGLSSRLQAWSTTQEKVVNRAEKSETLCAAHRYAECVQVTQTQKVVNPEQEILLGKAFTALGDEQQAAAAFADALNHDKVSAQSGYWLFWAYKRLALESLNHMVELAPDSWRANETQGEYYQLRSDYKKAIEAFQTALRARPDSAELHEELGDAYLLDKNAAEGKAEIAKALRLDPTRTRSLFLMARLYFQERDMPKSIEYFQRALRFEPSFLPARAGLGRAYMRIGKPGSAVPELEKASPTDYYGDLHFLLSTAYRQMGRADLAEQALAVSQELRKKSAAHHQAAVAAAEDEFAIQ